MPRFSASTVVPHAGDLIVPGSLGAHALAWLGQLAGAERTLPPPLSQVALEAGLKDVDVGRCPLPHGFGN